MFWENFWASFLSSVAAGFVLGFIGYKVYKHEMNIYIKNQSIKNQNNESGPNVQIDRAETVNITNTDRAETSKQNNKGIIEKFNK